MCIAIAVMVITIIIVIVLIQFLVFGLRGDLGLQREQRPQNISRKLSK